MGGHHGLSNAFTRGDVLRPVGRAALPLVLLALSSCGRDGDAVGGPGTPDSGESGFKNLTVDNAVAGSGVTNIIALSFNAPSNGYAWASATGTCSVVEPLPISSVLAAQIETNPADRSPHAGDAWFSLGGAGAAPSEGSFGVMRVLPAATGENIVYLNVDNPSAGGKMYCSASMTVLFRSQQLP